MSATYANEDTQSAGPTDRPTCRHRPPRGTISMRCGGAMRHRRTHRCTTSCPRRAAAKGPRPRGRPCARGADGRFGGSADRPACMPRTRRAHAACCRALNAAPDGLFRPARMRADQHRRARRPQGGKTACLSWRRRLCCGRGGLPDRACRRRRPPRRPRTARLASISCGHPANRDCATYGNGSSSSMRSDILAASLRRASPIPNPSQCRARLLIA